MTLPPTLTATFGSLKEVLDANIDLSVYSDIFTLGRFTKNDGGGGHYKQYDAEPLYLGFSTSTTPSTHWGLVPDGGVVNPLQSVKSGDLVQLQECIDYIQLWNATATTSLSTGLTRGKDSNQSAIKLILPANHTFTVDLRGGLSGLRIQSPITIEGEDPVTSKIVMLDDLVAPPAGTGIDSDGLGGANVPNSGNLFLAQGPDSATPNVPVRIRDIRFRNFTLSGNYAVDNKAGKASLLVLNNVDGVVLDNMTFTRNGAVLIGGDGVRNLVMRRCILSESRRGGLVLSGAANITIEDNDFRWVPDDPIAINASGPNIVGAKNVLIEGNSLTFSRGRAIHVGTVTDQEKGDTAALNIIVHANLIIDPLDSTVDPRFDGGTGGHRAIDIELLTAAPGPLLSIPGLPYLDTNSLAELYDPDTMPADLRRAHAALDLSVDRLHLHEPFACDSDRVERLFGRYEALANPPRHQRRQGEQAGRAAGGAVDLAPGDQGGVVSAASTPVSSGSSSASGPSATRRIFAPSGGRASRGDHRRATRSKFW